MESAITKKKRRKQTIDETIPDTLRLIQGVIVVRSVVSSDSGKRRSSIAAGTLDRQLSKSESSHGKRHGFCCVFREILVKHSGATFAGNTDSLPDSRNRLETKIHNKEENAEVIYFMK